MVATFAADALVNDDLTEISGSARIRLWAEDTLARSSFMLYVRSAVVRPNTTTLLAHVDGTFERRGLPDPLLLTFISPRTPAPSLRSLILRNVAEL